MRYLRLTAVMILVSLVSLLSGCGEKTYLFNFTVEPDLSRADGTWISSHSGYELSSEGIILESNWIAAPYLFNGDFTVTYDFEMKQDLLYTRMVYFVLASQANYLLADWSWALAISDYNYEPGDFRLTQVLDGYSTNIVPPKPMDEVLNYPGANTFVVKKTGSFITFELNGYALGDGFAIEGYYLDWLCPHIGTFYEMGSDMDMDVFKVFEVKYKGDLVPSS